MDKVLEEYSKSVIKRKYGDALKLLENTEKDIELFKADIDEVIPVYGFKLIDYTDTDIEMLWNDYKESTYYEEYKNLSRSIDWDKDVVRWGDKSREDSTKSYIKNNLGILLDKYPLQRTSRLLKWYSIYGKIVLELGIYKLTKRDYDWFFALKGERLDGEYQFYTIVKTLCAKQVKDKRKEVLEKLLSDEKVIQQLKNNAFILPARAQFYLSTPQVYDAWIKSMMEDKSESVFKKVKKLMDEGLDFDTALKEAEK